MKRLVLACMFCLIITGCGGAGPGGNNNVNNIEGGSGGSDGQVGIGGGNDAGGNTGNTVNAGSDNLPINLALAASKAIPKISGNLETVDLSTSKFSGEYMSESSAKWEVEQFFKAECHMIRSGFNMCPEGEDLTLNNKFSLGTLIGLIYHADMYFGGVYRFSNGYYKTCSQGENPAELENHAPVFHPADSDMYVVDFKNLFDCVAQFSHEYNGHDQVSYVLYSKSEDDRIFATLTSRKEHESEEYYCGIMSDIFQIYVSRDEDGNLKTLGFNVASFDRKDTGGTGDFRGRSVLILNIRDHKFVVKGGNRIVALGAGGYNFEAKEWIEGYYMIKITGENDSHIFCVHNSDKSSIVDSSYCEDISGFFSENGWTWGELHNWLGLDNEDRQNLHGFDKFFKDPLPISDDDIPVNGVDFYPDSISK